MQEIGSWYIQCCSGVLLLCHYPQTHCALEAQCLQVTIDSFENK